MDLRVIVADNVIDVPCTLHKEHFILYNPFLLFPLEDPRSEINYLHFLNYSCKVLHKFLVTRFLVQIVLPVLFTLESSITTWVMPRCSQRTPSQCHIRPSG